MAALYSIWKRLSHVRLDGMHYDICGKQREDGRFTVAWVCLHCCEQGPPIPATETLERAVSFAHIGLRAHHGLVHGRLNDHLADDGSAPCSGSHVPDDSSQEARKETAYSELCAAYEKLCTANAMIRSCSGHNLGSNSSLERFEQACREWNECAFNFDAALRAYSANLSERTQAIDTQSQPPAATTANQPLAATRR